MEEEVDGDVNVGWKIWRQTAEILYHFLGYCGAGRPRGGERGGGGKGRGLLILIFHRCCCCSLLDERRERVL